MHTPSRIAASQFRWTPQPEAAELLHDCVDGIVAGSPWLQTFRRRLRDETGTRLFDWIDHLVVADALTDRLRKAGFHREADGPAWVHTGGLFPRVLAAGDADTPPTLGIRVESLDDFLRAQQLEKDAQIMGEPGCAFRQAAWVAADEAAAPRAVERHGFQGFSAAGLATPAPETLTGHFAAFRGRARNSAGRDGFHDAQTKFARAAAQLGRDRACDLFFAAERDYWQSRNHAARVQRARQDALGLGWANHDHHTFRCSREFFGPLVEFLEGMGFVCRERFYAGSEAGWGAQVLEQPACGLVVFADVDMSPEEVAGDFAHVGLPARDELGTVGLWCKLHGDSFLAAGMHHLECQFDFDAARRQLKQAGVETMSPFTDFPYLRQAFTQGEVWQVEKTRLDGLAARGLLTAVQVDRFASEGALGSHLEILERNDGYKGFNQTGVSQIIRETDPRKVGP